MQHNNNNWSTLTLFNTFNLVQCGAQFRPTQPIYKCVIGSRRGVNSHTLLTNVAVNTSLLLIDALTTENILCSQRCGTRLVCCRRANSPPLVSKRSFASVTTAVATLTYRPVLTAREHQRLQCCLLLRLRQCIDVLCVTNKRSQVCQRTTNRIYCYSITDYYLLIRERFIATLIVSRPVCLWFCLSFCLSAFFSKSGISRWNKMTV